MNGIWRVEKAELRGLPDSSDGRGVVKAGNWSEVYVSHSEKGRFAVPSPSSGSTGVRKSGSEKLTTSEATREIEGGERERESRTVKTCKDCFT